MAFCMPASVNATPCTGPLAERREAGFTFEPYGSLATGLNINGLARHTSARADSPLHWSHRS
jgi:hypothetical protein